MSKDAKPIAADQVARDDRSAIWGRLRTLGVSGAMFGADGELWRAFWLGVAALAALLVLSNTINVLTLLYDTPQIGVAAPIVWEGSSAVTMMLFCWIPWLALRAAPIKQPWWRVPLVHPAAALLFSVTHVAGFVLIRKLAYWAAGGHYGIGPLTDEFPYEFFKDIRSYIIIIAIFWCAERLARTAAPIAASTAQPALAAYYDVRDGAKLTRVALADILAVSSADNYVEFALRDGRRLMMRKSLSAVEADLGAQGFLRTHRSWLINPTHVSAIKPEGSGDYSVELGTLTAPLSRRFPHALAKLRGG